MRNAAPEISAPVGIIAGGGTLPFAVADSLAARGIASILLAVKGFADVVRVPAYRHKWIVIGKLGQAVGYLRAENCRDLVFIGGAVRPAISEVRLDWMTLQKIPRIVSAFRGGDNHLFSGIAEMLEELGFRVRGIPEVAPDLLMPEGAISRASPEDRQTLADIAKGRQVLSAMSPFDTGQGVIVIDGHVIAIEDIGGTDGLLARVARLRTEGRVRAKPGRGVLVKAPKTTQDLRLDLPALGPRTIEGIIAAGLAGIAVVAGRTVVAEPQAIVDAADKAGVFVIGTPG